MNQNKPTKPLQTIANNARSCCDLFLTIRDKVKSIQNANKRAHQLRDAYALLRNTKTALTQYGPTRSIMNLVNRNGELAHAINVMIPPITESNKVKVVTDICNGIDHTVVDLMDRLKTYGKESIDINTSLMDSFKELAVNQKSLLCDVRQWVSAMGYDDQSTIANTTICGYSRNRFTEKISALGTLYKALTNPWSDWNKHSINRALNKLGYTLSESEGEDLNPEENPEEPLDPEMMIVPKNDVEEGSDTPIPDTEVDPESVAPSVEQPTTGTMQDLGWSRKTMLDSINSLIAAVDKVKTIDFGKEHLTKASESLDAIPDQPSDYRAHEKAILSGKQYFSMFGETLSVYGRELNNLVNTTINMVVRLRGHLDRKS